MLTTQQVKCERACPRTCVIRLAHHDVADAAYAAEGVRLEELLVFQVRPLLLGNGECPHYCHSPRRPATIFCRPSALAASPCTGAVTTTSMRDQKRRGGLVIGALPSCLLKKLP